jgi:hypothetical protein
MADRVLTLRELNRATLQRQMLLERQTLTAPAAIERLVGLQAQLPSAPYVALWTRLRNFSRTDLARSIEDRLVIKATLMRATLHLFTAEDYVRFRTTLQPVMAGAATAIAKHRGGDFDVDKLLKAARRFISEKPRTFAEISDMVTQLMPGQDVGAMRYTVRTHLSLVQVPIAGGWSYSNKPEFTLAESWIGQPISSKDNLRDLVLRYLVAFGPASVTDMQTWMGLKLRETFEKLRGELRTYRDEGRRELFDLPDKSLPDGELPASVRFLPEYDNLLLSHNNRTRVIADGHRSRVYLPGLRVAATVLVDGFLRGSWKIERSRNVATLVVEPFESLTRRDRADLTEEGEKLVRFVEADSRSFEVRFG